jgi:ribose/xylose/arabinose/galactoside ABC-type transport system permease subunit
MKSIDDIPYAILGAGVAAACFLLGNAFTYQFLWQLWLAPVVGGALGYVAGVMTLRSRKLPFTATLGEFKAANSAE